MAGATPAPSAAAAQAAVWLWKTPMLLSATPSRRSSLAVSLPASVPDGSTSQRHCLAGPRGRDFPGPWGVSKSRNITSHKTAGLGDWTDAEIKTAITQGKRKDGTPLKGPMGFEYYAKMTDADLDAVIAYVRTLPAKE